MEDTLAKAAWVTLWAALQRKIREALPRVTREFPPGNRREAPPETKHDGPLARILENAPFRIEKSDDATAKGLDQAFQR